jgi:hypothetical protein
MKEMLGGGLYIPHLGEGRNVFNRDAFHGIAGEGN